jgi:hypothetical protein
MKRQKQHGEKEKRKEKKKRKVEKIAPESTTQSKKKNYTPLYWLYQCC